MTFTLHAALAVATATAPLASASPLAIPVPAGLTIGRPAPPFTLTTIDGKSVSLAAYHGKTLVINVWGSWCPPCRLETPDLIAESEAPGNRDVAFLGIDTTETEPVVRAYAAAKGIPYAMVAPGERSDFARDYDITNYPTTFVIDPSGVLRAVHADNILPRAQLRAYVAAAKDGRTAPLASAEQQKLDAMLDPARFPLTGDSATVLANGRAAEKAIGGADDEMDDAMIDPARDHDLLRTKGEQNALRSAALAALVPLARSTADRVLVARMQGEQEMASGQFAAAAASYRAALDLAPDDAASLAGLRDALSEAGDDAAVLAIAQRLAGRYPSALNLVALARAEAAVHDRTATVAAIAAATPLARGLFSISLTRFHLAAGRAAVAAGDDELGRTQFEAAEAAAEGIPRSDARYAWYLEQSQEAQIALGLSGASGIAVTIAPWTGPNLPGSVASTYKYRVALSGGAGTNVTLGASGLPAKWIASFCTDRVCSPFRVRTTIPDSGVKVLEFQVIPEGPDLTAHPTVRIAASAGAAQSATTTLVR